MGDNCQPLNESFRPTRPFAFKVNLFREGCTRGYGAGLCRNVFNPYNRKFIRGRGSFWHDRHQSVFLRLGPQQSPTEKPTKFSKWKVLLSKIYNRKHSASPTLMVTAVSGQLDTPGSYWVFNWFWLWNSNTAHWSHIPQDQGRRGGTRSGDRRIDYKGGSEEVDFCQAKFVSPMIIVPKKGEKWRLVHNLQSLNQYISKAHFKLEDIWSLKDILNQGDFMGKLDLKKAYLSVLITYQSRRILQFRWKDKLLQFTYFS